MLQEIVELIDIMNTNKREREKRREQTLSERSSSSSSSVMSRGKSAEPKSPATAAPFNSSNCVKHRTSYNIELRTVSNVPPLEKGAQTTP